MNLREKGIMASKKEKFAACIMGGTKGTLTREWKVAFYFMLDCLYDILDTLYFVAQMSLNRTEDK